MNRDSMPPAELEGDRQRWNERYRVERELSRVNANLVRYANWLERGWVLDLAGGRGQNAAWLAGYDSRFRPVIADVSDEGLALAPRELARVLADAATLPFLPGTFDTILCIRFFDPRVDFADWLAPGGTVFFETFTDADARYRPDFNPAHRLQPGQLEQVFRNLEILLAHETDDGKRVYATVIARKAGVKTRR